MLKHICTLLIKSLLIGIHDVCQFTAYCVTEFETVFKASYLAIFVYTTNSVK